MASMTIRQRECLAFIRSYVSANDGVSPSMQEIADGIGLRSKSGVHRLVHALIERGQITALAKRRRCMTPVNNQIDLSGVSTLELKAELAKRVQERVA